MDRKEFLSLIGLGATAAVCSYCLSACKVADMGPTAPTNVDFTVDLTNPTYAGLAAAGGSLVNAGVIVAHTPNGYVAVSAACTHQGNTVTYDRGANDFFCPAHGSTFALNGNVTRGPAGSPLATYKTSLNGGSLRVFS